MYYPPQIKELLDECPERIARVSQIEVWLNKYKDYYEWCSTIWSLTDLEEGSEEHAFMDIYHALQKVMECKSEEATCRHMMDSFPGEDDDMNLPYWIWVDRYFEYYYEDLVPYDSEFNLTDFDFEEGRRHLSVTIPFYREVLLYVHMDDFSFLFEVFENYYQHLGMDSPYEEPKDPYTKGIWLRREFTPLPEEEEDHVHEILMARTAFLKLLSFHETMVEFEEIVAWVEDTEPIYHMLHEEHEDYCGCESCYAFNIMFQRLKHLVNLEKQEQKFMEYAKQYKLQKKSPPELAQFHLRYFKDIDQIDFLKDIRALQNNLVEYQVYVNDPVELQFTFYKPGWEDMDTYSYSIKKEHDAMVRFLTEKYNLENKTYFAKCSLEMLRSLFQERLESLATEFFVEYEERWFAS
ncbi:MAG: hypothetical protein IPN79_17105 [Saprospiraceae bacterium]|nr:hypothetical protein [Saprospiraceae bacterium]